MRDVVIVGGGPAGLSAALVLSRCRRDVLMFDAGRGRNQRSRELHNFLTRNGVAPAEFRAMARSELATLGVTVIEETVTDAERRGAGFAVKAASGEWVESRKLLLATGVHDVLPTLDGLERMYGTSVHHCPYCDAYQHRDKRLAAYGKGTAAIGLALALRTWSRTVTALTDGEAVSEAWRTHARVNGIALRTERVSRLIGEGEQLRRVLLESGEGVDCEALFFNTGQVQRSELGRKLGCELMENGGIKTNVKQCAGVPGLFVAGDADKDVQFVVCAAAEGATAAVAINRELQDEERGKTPEA